MLTELQVNAIASRIYNQARAGTQVNPGLPVDLSNLVVAQAKHETGNFASNAFTKYNNAFGYSYAGSTYQTGPGLIADNGQPVGSYKNVEDSTKEIVDWIYRRRGEGKFPADLASIKTPALYADLLKKAGYYGDTLQNYLNGLTAFFKVISPGASGLAALAIVVGLVGWIYFRSGYIKL